MSALTLVMKEVDMNAEEFVNVRAYHIRGARRSSLTDDAPLTSPSGSDDSSSVGSLAISNSEEETRPSTPSSTASRRTVSRKDQRSRTGAKKGKQTQPEYQKKKGIKIIFDNRDILNLERNLQPYQWQMRSPLCNSYTLSSTANQRSSIRFVEYSGALVEIVSKCSDCDFREPTTVGNKMAPCKESRVSTIDQTCD